MVVSQVVNSVFERVENNVENGENAGYWHFHIFPQCFNPFPNKPLFLRVCSTSLLKTLWEKEKLLVTSTFSFSHSVFYPFGQLSAIIIKLKIVVCKLAFLRSPKFVVKEA